MVARRPYATRDGFVCALPYTTKHWKSFFSITPRRYGRSGLIQVRSEKIGELYELVSDLVVDWDTEDLLKALEEGDIPHGEATSSMI